MRDKNNKVIRRVFTGDGGRRRYIKDSPRGYLTHQFDLFCLFYVAIVWKWQPKGKVLREPFEVELKESWVSCNSYVIKGKFGVGGETYSQRKKKWEKVKLPLLSPSPPPPLTLRASPGIWNLNGL